MTTTSSMLPDPWLGFDGHEEAVVAQDESTGMRAVIAIHSTVLGPSLGGVRMSTYSDAPEGAAAASYADALRLSRAMTYKNALAGLPHGGGKAVILHDPNNKPAALLHAFGRLVSSLDGRYVTAGDVGMRVQDMDTIGETCRWTTGRSPEHGGVGDSGILTAVGVHAGMRAGAEAALGSSDLNGVSVGVIGAGKVGGRLIRHLLDDGARVAALDPSSAARQALEGEYPGQIAWVDSLEDLLARQIDVLSPNALGGAVTESLVQILTSSGVRLVSGGANNQLATPEVGDLLDQAGIVYTPDFCVNCGGVIQVAEELVGADLDRARAKVEDVFGTTRSVLRRAKEEGLTPVQAAEREAEARIDAARG
jgi:valine dehydrogenase (NAD+)